MADKNSSVFNEKSEFLPDIRNEKPSELVAFDQRVFRLNEKYIKNINEIIAWHQSPAESMKDPSMWKSNKTSLKLKAKRYAFDINHNILFQLVKNSDGIHIY